MAEDIKEVFFSDKVRSVLTIGALILIATLLFISWMFPRSSHIDQKTTQTLQNVSTQLEHVATTLGDTAAQQAELTKSLERELHDRNVTREDEYEKLLKDYGYDIPKTSSSNVGSNSSTGVRP